MDLRAALVARCPRGALPPVDLLAVCLVLDMSSFYDRIVHKLSSSDTSLLSLFNFLDLSVYLLGSVHKFKIFIHVRSHWYSLVRPVLSVLTGRAIFFCSHLARHIL